MTVIGIMFTAAVLIVLAAVVATPAVAAIAVYARERRRRRDEHYRLAADADRQHAAMVRGDLETGVYGRFHPFVHDGYCHCSHCRGDRALKVQAGKPGGNRWA